MNVGLVTGFVIGGMLLLSLMVLNNRIAQNSGQTALTQMTKETMTTVSEMVSTDIRRIGQGIAAAPITHASENRIVFLSAVDGINPATVEWLYDPNEELPGSQNPNDRMLYRIVNNDTTRIPLGVTQFNFTYFDEDHAITAVLDQIRRIRVEVMVESQAGYGNEFSRSFWESEITPRAIQ
ncbi:MAG: hypothetical protein LAT57_03210 [Balneolales bacterium]|nr:hypothetical protein [Balneolales bacterium]